METGLFSTLNLTPAISPLSLLPYNIFHTFQKYSSYAKNSYSAIFSLHEEDLQL